MAYLFYYLVLYINWFGSHIVYK